MVHQAEVVVGADARGADADGPRLASGSLDEVAADFRALIEMGAEYVVLDTNPDHPRDRRPAADDRRDLAALAESVAACRPDLAYVGIDGRPEDQRLPEAATWGQYPGGLTVEKGDPLFPRLTV